MYSAHHLTRNHSVRFALTNLEMLLACRGATRALPFLAVPILLSSFTHHLATPHNPIDPLGLQAQAEAAAALHALVRNNPATQAALVRELKLSAHRLFISCLLFVQPQSLYF